MLATKTPKVNIIPNVNSNGKLNFEKCLEQKRLAKGALSPARLQCSCGEAPRKRWPFRRGGEECGSLRAGGCPGRRGEPRGALELVAPPAACCLPFRAFPDFDLFFLTLISSWIINWLNCVPAARARILFFSGYFHCGGARIHILDSRYPPPPPQQVGLGRTRAWGSQAPGQIM